MLLKTVKENVGFGIVFVFPWENALVLFREVYFNWLCTISFIKEIGFKIRRVILWIFSVENAVLFCWVTLF